MSNKRKIEVFSAGCPACEETVELVNSLACPSCEVTVLNMSEDGVARRAKSLGIERIPAVVIDGNVAECCKSASINADSLTEAGLGQQR